MRRLGVYGVNLPTKKERSVAPADFAVAGLYGRFSRRYAKAFEVRNTQDAFAILGPQEDSATYGWDAINGFFANLAGSQGSLYIAPYKNSGSVQASASLNNTDSAPEPALKLAAAYQDEVEYGLSGNRTGFTLTLGSAFSSAVTTLPTGSGVALKTIVLASAVGIKVGDVLKLSKTGYAEYHYVTDANEATKTVIWADADYAGTGTAADYTADVLAMKIKVYRKDLKGIVSEVDKDIGKLWCTMNAADPDRYVENIFSASAWMQAIVLGVTGSPTAAQLFPAAVASVQYLTSGAEGTEPASLSDWQTIYALLDDLPVRMVANVESSNAAYQAGLEAYCLERDDNPIAIIVGAYALATKAAVQAAGQSWQRSDEVDAVYVHNWLGVVDPFSQSSVRRAVPNAGHLMGLWIASITIYGIHASPARKTLPIKGATEVYGYEALSDDDRTDLANAGVNVIQDMAGRGLILRNLFTPSMAPEFKYANALIQRNYVKASCVDSLQESENTPNDIAQVREDRMAVLQFMNKLWLTGSNGNIREGETFGRYENDDGTMSTVADAFEVIADASNNSVATLQAGERNVDVWFMFPAPAGSIKIGVGLIYKTQ